MNYLTRVITDPVPQSEPLDERQVQNDAGGYSYPVDDMTRLDRFLILGSEDGSYYTSERELTLENTQAVKRCAQQNGTAAVERICGIAKSGRATRFEPPLFALAACASYGDEETRKLALSRLPGMARTATQLMIFIEFADGMRRWGRGLRNAVRDWYLNRTPAQIAYQVVKYRQRNGWTHRDLLRKSHAFIGQENAELREIFQWVTHGDLPTESDATRIILAFEQAREADVGTLVRLIRDNQMTWEMIPPERMNEPAVWEALSEEMLPVATLRNLASMTHHGVIAPMKFQRAVDTIGRIGNKGELPIHPVNVLKALLTYRSGKGQRGGNSWEPVSQVVDALDNAFERSFQDAPRTNARLYLGIDVSGSMGQKTVAGVTGLTPRMAAAAMAMAVARREPNHHMAGFSQEMVPLSISAQDRLESAMERTQGLPFARTDCARPMLDALSRRIPVDCFIILTDAETWYGNVHPMEALREYRQKMDIPAKLVTVGMISNYYTIADPQDAGTMDIVGLDRAAPELISAFISEGKTGTSQEQEE